MDKMMRYSAKAIIIRDDKLLTVNVDYGRGRFSKLPGGKQEWGETLEETIVRECKEEINIKVNPERLVLIRDYIAKNHKQTLDLECFHLIEIMFYCTADDYSSLGLGSEPDSDSEQIKWIDLNDLAQSDFYPKAIIPYLKNIRDQKESVYLGDVN